MLLNSSLFQLNSAGNLFLGQGLGSALFFPASFLARTFGFERQYKERRLLSRVTKSLLTWGNGRQPCSAPIKHGEHSQLFGLSIHISTS